jgi:hypothetical protein
MASRGVWLRRNGIACPRSKLLGRGVSYSALHQIRVFSALFGSPNAENRIKCGSDAVFPQQSWYKMAHIAANQKSSIEEDSWLQV